MTTGEAIITGLLGIIIFKLFNMPTKAEFDALREEMNTSLTNIADDITRLANQGSGGGLTPDEQAQVFNDLRAVADRIRSIADVTPEPEQPPTE